MDLLTVMNLTLGAPVELEPLEIESQDESGVEFGSWCASVRSCSSCKLAPFRTGLPVVPAGSLDSEVVFIGRNPSFEEARNCQTMVDGSTALVLFWSWYLVPLGLNLRDVYCTNMMFCGNILNTCSSDGSDRDVCIRFKQSEFSMLTRVKLVFLMGHDALKGVIHPDLDILAHYGNHFIRKDWKNGGAVWFVPVFNPMYVWNHRNVESLLRDQLRIVGERFRTREFWR